MILEEYRKIPDFEETLSNVNSTTQTISGQAAHLNTEFLQQECKEVVETVGKFKLNLKREDIGAGVSGVSKSGGTGSPTK